MQRQIQIMLPAEVVRRPQASSEDLHRESSACRCAAQRVLAWLENECGAFTCIEGSSSSPTFASAIAADLDGPAASPYAPSMIGGDSLARLGHVPLAAALVVAVAFVAVLGAGCGRDESLLLHCNSREGEYFDYMQGGCAVPTDDETLYRLYNYQRLQQRVATGDKAVLQQVSLRRWIDHVELQSLIDDPRIDRIERIVFFLPSVSHHGWTSPEDLPVTSTKATAIEDGERRVLSTFASRPTDFPLRRQIELAVAASDYRVSVLRVVAKPSAMMALWQAHPNLVRFIQPMDGTIGKMQEAFEPEEVISR
ncbi:hypothetical protein GF380_01380 [Candidatus Uhrbacteria bacterium]|nr:hypothetical protein [Candidatus Uhrbacteria bacterium]MBD3283931.1 hypothetical protein [Candidatus Uhrbacteria bacterium]